MDPSAGAAPFLGRYRVLRRIASGGMAEVLLGRLEGPIAFERHVAIKRVLPHLVEDSELATMFVDEAHLLARLRHPNVVAIEDFGHEGDELFLVMEYLEGESLARCLKVLLAQEQRFPFEVAAYVVAGAAAGLHAAHELTSPDGMPLHLVHRDVSPQNVFVLYGGHVKIIDFGIARHGQRLAHTLTGSIKGKLGYMAPEQLTGRPVDRRTDVFALGIVLFELLTMRPLFRRETELAVANAILADPIPTPRSLVPSIPAELDEICMRALAREPEDRFPTAQAMCAALQRCFGSRTAAEIEARLGRWMRGTFAREQAEKREWTKDSVLLPEAPPQEDALTAERAIAQPGSLAWALESTRELPAPSAPPPRWSEQPPPRPSSSPPSALASTPAPSSTPASPEGADTSSVPTPASFPAPPATPSTTPPSFTRAPAARAEPPTLPPTERPSAPSPVSPTSPVSLTSVVAILGAIMATGVLLAFVVRARREPRSSESIVAVALEDEPTAPPPVQSADSRVDPTGGTPTPAAPATRPAGPDTADVGSVIDGVVARDIETVVLVVASRPPGAEVWIDGRLAGTTPATIAVPRRDSPAVLELRRDGRTRWREELALDRDRDLDYVLPDATSARPRPTQPRRDGRHTGIDVDYE